MKLLGLLAGFWFLGVVFGAGVVNCLWANRDGDGLQNAIVNTAVILAGTFVFFILVAVRQWSKKPREASPPLD